MCFAAVKNNAFDKLDIGKEPIINPKPVQLEIFTPSYKLSAFNHDYIPIIRTPESIEFFSWGFIQPLQSDTKESAEIKFMTANAKAETVFEKKLYQKAILDNRCIIVLDGFFEWRHVNKKTFPHYIYHATDRYLFIGGIWNTFSNPETGETKQTVSMITTAANPMMEVIHNMKKRMPMILDRATALDWINPKLTTNDMIELMQPYPQEKMKYHTVGKKLEANTEETIKPVVYPELASEQQSLF